MNPPDLHALQTGDADAWDEAFDRLWPTTFAVAQLKLQPYFPNEAEDVAIEALEELVEKVRAVKSVEELKPPLGEILSDFFIHGLRYEEIAKKRGVAVGSVGVYLKRGLEAMRRIWGRRD